MRRVACDERPVDLDRGHTGGPGVIAVLVDVRQAGDRPGLGCLDRLLVGRPVGARAVVAVDDVPGEVPQAHAQDVVFGDGPTDEALEPGPFLGGHAVAQGLAVEERLDSRLGDERRLRLALGEAASVGLGLEVDGEGRPQDDHGDEADRGMDAEEPDHRTPGSAPIPHTARYRRRGHRTGPGNAC